ncbi:Uncharacterized protein APZ42_017898 [Daphnia magna]|uniref:Uncharacterized protein n=1 Tax=Daphnia magna TaxID=35525 RepID=A0A164ZEC2_9CRUS|nr:Uncharacterized protein APZ42_017898 [Daphnia magna]
MVQVALRCTRRSMSVFPLHLTFIAASIRRERERERTNGILHTERERMRKQLGGPLCGLYAYHAEREGERGKSIQSQHSTSVYA